MNMFPHVSIAVVSVFLSLVLSVSPALFFQSSGNSTSPASSQKREISSSTINLLLQQRPLPSESESPNRAPQQNRDGRSEPEPGPPADDAPIKDLIDYWAGRKPGKTTDGTPGPSDVVRNRLLDAVEKKPWLLPKLFDFLPENTDTHDRLYKVLTADPREFEQIEDNNWRPELYWWLQSHTQYLRSELIEAVRNRDNNDPDKLDELEALANLDWPTAKPLLERIAAAGMSGSTPKALALLYEDAVKRSETTQAETYRAPLKEIVANTKLSFDWRRVPLEKLLIYEWAGDEEWYVSLFSNPTLSGLRLTEQMWETRLTLLTHIKNQRASGVTVHLTGPDSVDLKFLSLPLKLKPEKWIPVVIGLIDHEDALIRGAAVSSLVEFLNYPGTERPYRENVARALLPWLTKPNWVTVRGRFSYLDRLAELDLPESVPGLIWILDNDGDYESRQAAARMLMRYCDPNAAAALKRAVARELDRSTRSQLVIASAACHGFTDEELVAALEAYTSVMTTPEGQVTIKKLSLGSSDKSVPLDVLMGQSLFESDMAWATESFAHVLFDRIDELRSARPVTHPEAAWLMLEKIRSLPLSIAGIKLVERINKGEADSRDLKQALVIRDRLADEAHSELADLVKRGGYAGGIAAVVLKDQRGQIEMLKGKDTQAQIALLAGARYLCDKLPIGLLGELPYKADPALAQALRSYLAIEGSAAARRLLSGFNPGELQIMGDLSCLADYQGQLGELKNWEERLRGEMRSPGRVDEIYALVPAIPSKRWKGMVIRVREGKAEVSIYDVSEHRKMRFLSGAEFRELKEFTSRPEVDDLGPENWSVTKPTMPYAYLHLTKESGRRVILDTFGAASKYSSLHGELSGLFCTISRSGDYQ